MSTAANNKKKTGLFQSASHDYRYNGELFINNDFERAYLAKQFLYNVREQAAMAYHLLCIIGEELRLAPLPVDDMEVAGVKDALASLAEPDGPTKV